MKLLMGTLSVNCRPRQPYAPRVVAAAIAVAGLWSSGCESKSAVGDHPRRPDIVLISIDTLRADHCSTYGYPRETTPNLDRIAAEGVLFETAYAPMGTTDPSHAAMLTGRCPLCTGVLRNGLRLPEGEETLAELFKDRGYRTAGFISSFPLSEPFGFAQGFDHFDDDFEPHAKQWPHKDWQGLKVDVFDRRSPETNRRAMQWLDGLDDNEPVFMWVHYFDPHAPYEPDAEYADLYSDPAHNELEKIVASYDSDVRMADAALGQLVDHIDKTRSDRDTIFVIVADHGEGLNAHGWLEHNRYTYEEEVRVPMVIRRKGKLSGGKRIKQPVILTDILPTLAAMADIKVPDDAIDGVCLEPVIAGRQTADASRQIYLLRPIIPGGRPQFGEIGVGIGVRMDQWKFFIAPSEERIELFDLTKDARELENLASFKPKVIENMTKLVGARMKHVRPRAKPESVGSRERDGLKSMGYLD